MKQLWLDKLDESLVKPFYNEQTETERAAAFEGDLTFGTSYSTFSSLQ